jgi:very-short-patch-repair endonuclease
LTLLDLAGVLGETDLVRALNEARVHGRLTDDALRATLAAHHNRRGARALRALLASEVAEFTVESEAEAVCLRRMLEHELKPDAAQVRIGRYRVDFLYRAERFVVEVDGHRFHGSDWWLRP